MMLRTIAALAAALVLAGCASLSGDTGEKLIVQIATMKFVEASADDAGRATRVIAAAEQAQTWLDTDGVTIADLQAAMLERIRQAGLAPSDQVLAIALADVVAAELNGRVGEGLLSPDQRLTVNAVLGWVIQAAGIYVGA